MPAKRTATGAEPAHRVAVETADPLLAVISALEEDIVLSRLHPRERLVEDSLMARFQTPRHRVREALARLEQMGLVERRRNIGALVRSFSLREVTELYEMRALLEGDAARRIALPPPAADMKALVAIQRQHDAAVSAADPRAVFRANLDFHRALFALAGNETLTQAIDEYARRTHAIRFSTLVSPVYRERARHEHWQMIEALRGADRERLVNLCLQHLLPSRDAYLEANRHHAPT